MEVVTAIVGAVVGVLTGRIPQKLRYLTSYAKHLECMKNRMKVLEDLSADIERLKRQHPNMPAHVPGWLEEVKKIKEDVDNIPSNNIGCFSVKKKFLAGRNALRLTKDIEGLISNGSGMISNDTLWREAEGCLGRVNSQNAASTSTPGAFNSRVKAFNDALKLLQEDDHTARVIALCGMGGVGKTTLMKQLKEAAEDSKMFKWIAVVTVGKSPKLSAIQDAIAEHIGKPLTKSDEKLRADYLSKRFKELLERNEKVLVILDDVWEKIKLEDIGLAGPLPKGVKLLLTSREESICHQIAVAKSVLKLVTVDVLEEEEARDFFCQIAEISAQDDRDLYEIGCEIVKKCGCLPLAIELIAAALKCQKNGRVWRHKLKCLKNNDLDNDVQEIIEISYNNLKKKEDKEIFLLCGLFTEDSNIPIEDLTRYAWGLKLLKDVSTMEETRDIIVASVSNLKNAYLLMDGDSHHTDCVKMHDLVLAFVVNTVSKGGEDGCLIIHHEDDFSKWSEANSMSQSCKHISLACKDMSKFPSDLRFPNLSLLKLMHGDESQRFPPGFYEGMEQLQVIAFEKLEYPLIPTPVQFSSNLRTLCLHECSLMFDLACIGKLSNLEVLSFANSGITILPSTFGNLKKLLLLDVTGCCNLVIDDGVLKGLVKLEELYMIPYGEKACCFTDNNSREFAERSENLKRFKLSVRCSFTEVRDHVQTDQVDMHSYENSLKLVTNREELLKSKINELFKITHALYLQVNDMNSLEDVEIPHPPPNSSFSNLRILVVSKCAKLTYLFTQSVATNLLKLEYLDISGCPNMEAVIHAENNRSAHIIIFSNLKYLRLAELPNLLCFCNKFQLPRLVELRLEGLQNFTSIYPSNASSSVSSNISRVQSFFHKEDATPKLKKLVVSVMENLKEIWPPQSSSSNLRMLKELRVDDCAELKYLFTPNVATNLSELEYLKISDCDAMEAVIHAENEGLYKIKFSNLKYLRLAGLQKLLCFCNKINVIELPHLMELELEGLPKITSIYHDSATSFVSSNISPTRSFLNKQDATPKLEKLFVKDCDSIELLFNMDFGEIEQLSSSSLRSIKVSGCDSLVKLFSCNPFPFLNNLEELNIESCRSIKVLFDIESGSTGNIGEQVCTSSLRSIVVKGCDSLVNLLPRNPMPLFNHLEELKVIKCASIEVIFDMDMGCVGEMDKVSSSRLRSIRLWYLGKLREVWRIKDAGNNNLIHGFEAVESIYICDCERFENLITPATTTFDMKVLKEVEIKWCGRESERKNELVEKEKEISKIAFPSSLLPIFYNLHKLDLFLSYEDVELVFEITSPISSGSAHNTQQQLIILPNLEELELYGLEKMIHVWKCDWNEFLILQKPQSQSSFHNLSTITMESCNSIKYLFSPLMAKLLSNLKKIQIKSCDAIEEVVSNRDDEDASIYSPTTAYDVVVFPHLKSIKLIRLPNFVGFFLGENEFRWPALEKVVFRECPQMTVFTYGRSTAPELKFINTSLGKHSVECGLNFHVTTTSEQARLPVYESTSSYSQLPWSYHNLIEVDMKDYNPSGGQQSLFPSDEVSQLQNLETVHLRRCKDIEEIFDSETDAEIPNLRQVDLVWLESLKYIWKSKQGTVLKFPNLTRLSIWDCDSLEYVFTCPMVDSLLQLQELHISVCPSMKVIVKGEEEECDAIVNANVVFPCLKSLTLEYLSSLEGFCIGKEAFEFPSLDTLQIYDCYQMRVFTKGDLSAPKLYAISTLGWKYNIHNRLNSLIENFTKEE